MAKFGILICIAVILPYHVSLSAITKGLYMPLRYKYKYANYYQSHQSFQVCKSLFINIAKQDYYTKVKGLIIIGFLATIVRTLCMSVICLPNRHFSMFYRTLKLNRRLLIFYKFYKHKQLKIDNQLKFPDMLLTVLQYFKPKLCHEINGTY